MLTVDDQPVEPCRRHRLRHLWRRQRDKRSDQPLSAAQPDREWLAHGCPHRVAMLRCLLVLGEGNHFRQREPPAVRLNLGQSLRLDHRRDAPHGEVLIQRSRVLLPRQLLRGQFTADLCGNSGDQAARRHDHLGLDEGERGDDRRLADHRVVIHDCVDPDHRVALDRRPVDHGTVADVAVFRDHRVLGGKSMDDAAVLNVRAALDDQATEIPAQRCARPDVDARTDNHVADQHRGRVHVCGGMNHRHDAVNRVDFHHAVVRQIGTDSIACGGAERGSEYCSPLFSP